MIARLLISNSLEDIKKEIEQTLASHLSGTNVNNHPDLLYFSSDSKLGIAEARKIKEHFSLKPYSGKGRAVVLENASNLTPEAQNALLKTIEELPQHALFVLSADSDSKLLPTIVSRCQITRLSMPGMGGVDMPGLSVDIEKLMNATIEERFEYIEKLKDRQEFLHSLVNYFHQNVRLHPKGVIVGFLQELLQAEEWQKQNVNIRAILEYLMLSLPSKV